MAPHYDRHADAAAEQNQFAVGAGPDDAAMDEAAESLREAEIEAVQPEVPDVSSLDPSQLDYMNIDELRAIAKELDVPDRGQITDKDELVAAIRQCM